MLDVCLTGKSPRVFFLRPDPDLSHLPNHFAALELVALYFCWFVALMLPVLGLLH